MKHLLFVIVIIGIISSCQTFKQWQRKGIINKWLDTTTHNRQSFMSLEKDTNKLNALVDSTEKGINNVIDSTYTANQNKPCPQIRDTIEKEVIKYLDKKFKPEIDKLPVFKDDSLTINNESYTLEILYKNGKLGYKLTYKKCTINTPYVWYKEWWWIWIIISFGLGIFIMYLANKSTK